MKNRTQILAGRSSKEMKRHYILIIESYSQSYLEQERDALKTKIKMYKSRLTEKDEQQVNEEINKEINFLSKQLRGLNFLLNDGRKPKKSKRPDRTKKVA